jgi:hypothetical protein
MNHTGDLERTRSTRVAIEQLIAEPNSVIGDSLA